MIFRNYGRVSAFLKTHSLAEVVVLDIPREVAKSFGNNCSIVFEVVSAEDGSEELLVLIQTQLDATRALAKLHELDEWWLNKHSCGNMIISVEFV